MIPFQLRTIAAMRAMNAVKAMRAMKVRSSEAKGILKGTYSKRHAQGHKSWLKDLETFVLFKSENPNMRGTASYLRYCRNCI